MSGPDTPISKTDEKKRMIGLQTFEINTHTLTHTHTFLGKKFDVKYFFRLYTLSILIR